MQFKRVFCLCSKGRLMHLYAICVDCLEGVHKIVCIKCKSRWDGSWHQLGTMYTYDILAASPCCQVMNLFMLRNSITYDLILHIAIYIYISNMSLLFVCLGTAQLQALWETGHRCTCGHAVFLRVQQCTAVSSLWQSGLSLCKAILFVQSS